MARDFYVVLGVSRDADAAAIRAAHRRLVRRYHPDCGCASADRFVEIQEAFETLSDEATRQRYDGELASTAPPSRREEQAPKRRCKPRVLDEMHHPVSVRDAADGLFDAIDEFMDAWLPGIFTEGRTATRRKDLYVEIVLTPDEAAKGGLFPLELPVREQCKRCGASGHVGYFVCPECQGGGIVSGRRSLEIAMPARVVDGTKACLSLEDVGLRGTDLNVLVSVQPWA